MLQELNLHISLYFLHKNVTFAFYKKHKYITRIMQTQIVSRIRKLRKEKGFTQPQMAEKLHIDQSAYARMELGETYSWAKYFEELLKIFEITPEKFFEGIGSNVVINNHQCPYSGNANVEHLHADSKVAYEKLLQAKDEQIALLTRLLEMKLK
jgi:transcriptional regulator with XRE-family HTH domain